MEIPETAWLVPVRCQGTATKFTLGPHTSPLTVFSVAVKRADKQRKSHPCQKAHGSLSISINCMLQSGHWDKGLSKGGTRRGESTSGVHLTYWALTMAKDCGKKITNTIVLWFECTFQIRAETELPLLQRSEVSWSPGLYRSGCITAIIGSGSVSAD